MNIFLLRLLSCVEDNQINKLLENIRALHSEENDIQNNNGHLAVENQAILFAINMHGLQNNSRSVHSEVVAFDEFSPRISHPSTSASFSSNSYHPSALLSNTIANSDTSDVESIESQILLPSSYNFEASNLECEMEDLSQSSSHRNLEEQVSSQAVLFAINMLGLQNAQNM